MNATMKKAMTSLLFAGAAASTIALAPTAAADPPPCYNPDGTPCAPAAGPQGAGAEVPGGPGAQAAPNGDVSAAIPGGPWAQAGPNGGVACIPGGPCRSIPVG